MTSSWNTPRGIDPKGRLFPWLILANTTIATFIGGGSAVAGFVADSNIRGALQMSSDDLQWISISFIMMLGIILPLAVYLAERFGYKRIFFAGIAFLTFGSLLNGLAFNFHTFLLSRMLAGAGAGALFPLSIAIINQTMPASRMPLAMALNVAFGFGFGNALGYYLSGYLCQWLSWPYAFIVFFILGLPVLLATWIIHPETPPQKDRVFDRFGYVLFTVFLTALLLTLNNAKAAWNTGGWTSPWILSTIFLCVLSLAILIPWEWKHSQPIIPLQLFKTRSFTFGMLAVILIGASLYASQIYAVNFYDGALHWQKQTIGAQMAVQTLYLGFMSTAVAFLSKRVSILLLTFSGLAILAISCFLQMNVTLYSDPNKYQMLLNARMIATALALGPATALALREIPQALGGAASMLVTFARQVGGTIGVVAFYDVIYDRAIFHGQMFGAQVDMTNPRLQQTLRSVQLHLERNCGLLPPEATVQATDIFRANVVTQSQVTATADAFYALGWIIAVVSSLLLLEVLWGWMKRNSAVVSAE
ncbi:MAG: MFS transporter [Verrucomicrobia bacterium]|nr:MFS transporter [Verrucomicrobiota bacterium]